MKKICFVFLMTFILLVSNLLTVTSLNNRQKNKVAQDFYSTGASFMRAEDFLKAKDFFNIHTTKLLMQETITWHILQMKELRNVIIF